MTVAAAMGGVMLRSGGLSVRYLTDDAVRQLLTSIDFVLAPPVGPGMKRPFQAIITCKRDHNRVYEWANLKSRAHRLTTPRTIGTTPMIA